MFGTSVQLAGALSDTAKFGPANPAAADAPVLLVEPSSAQAVVIRGFLEALGIRRIQRCRTGAEALEALPQFGAEVVVSAMHLDDMTGLELARRMATPTPGKRIGFVLISSTKDAGSLQDQTHEMGLILLAKPFDDQQLAVALREAAASSVPQ